MGQQATQREHIFDTDFRCGLVERLQLRLRTHTWLRPTDDEVDLRPERERQVLVAHELVHL